MSEEHPVSDAGAERSPELSPGAAPVPSSQVRGIVLTHGTMCHGMVDAVRKITGVEDEALLAISNEGLGPEALLRMVTEVVGEGPVIIFTDLQTGSCALAARFACRDPGTRTVVFGANLPMLLDFVFQRHLPLEELVERLVERGKTGIRALERKIPDAHRTDPGG
jgi:mannose/fructose-specific phosphotransferase system component IIA